MASSLLRARSDDPEDPGNADAALASPLAPPPSPSLDHRDHFKSHAAPAYMAPITAICCESSARGWISGIVPPVQSAHMPPNGHTSILRLTTWSHKMESQRTRKSSWKHAGFWPRFTKGLPSPFFALRHRPIATVAAASHATRLISFAYVLGPSGRRRARSEARTWTNASHAAHAIGSVMPCSLQSMAQNANATAAETPARSKPRRTNPAYAR